MPIPAPIDPRPAPTPRAIPLPASVMGARSSDWEACARGLNRSITCAPFLLVLLGDRAAEVDGCQGREDERLEGGDQADLEDEEDEGERERRDPERRDPQ